MRALFDYTLRIGIEEDIIYPVSAQRISSILKSVIKDAGMDTSVITARCFRSGGATSGIKEGVQPDQLMKIGRWKSSDVFYNNYVAARPRIDTTDRMLGLNFSREPSMDSSSVSVIELRDAYLKDPNKHVEDIEEEEEDISEELVEVVDLTNDSYMPINTSAIESEEYYSSDDTDISNEEGHEGTQLYEDSDEDNAIRSDSDDDNYHPRN